MDYTNREVLKLLKQYDMFLSSLTLTVDGSKKERICDQLDKVEKQILLETNNEYEKEYMLLLEEETSFLADEKTRLKKLINLVNLRKKYLEERKTNHKIITGSLVELTTFLGEDKVMLFKNRLKIIEKYEENKIRQQSLIKELKDLDIKISESSRNVKSNTRLNDILENKMMALIGKTIDKLNLYSLMDKKEEIEKKYETLNYALVMAKENLENAQALGKHDMIIECDNMLSEIALEHAFYKEKMNILKLMDIYDKPVTTYDEILSKREEINDILKNIPDSDFYKEVIDELNKAYNTIKLQKNDIENYEKLKEDREKKNNKLYEIDEENNSKEFKDVLEVFIKNEEKVKDEQIRFAKMQEYQERQKRILQEQKIEAARVKRQKLIEEARLKEQIETTKRVRELQEKTILNKNLFDQTLNTPNEISNKEENTDHSLFDSIKNESDLSLFKEEDNNITKIEVEDKIKDKEESIYNNDNLAFKNDEESDVIPIIENNNLKPEVIVSNKEDITFPDFSEKEGDLLWKETL